MNNVFDNLGYIGIVTLSIQCTKSKKIKSTKVIKNNGTVNLFKFLCECLIQRYSGANAPRYLNATSNEVTYKDISTSTLNSLTSALSYKSKLSNTQLIQKSVEYGDVNISGHNWHAIFNGVILDGQIKTNTEIRSLQLYASQSATDISSPLAFINLGDDSVKLNSGEALLVEWDMSFNNWTIKTSASSGE